MKQFLKRQNRMFLITYLLVSILFSCIEKKSNSKKLVNEWYQKTITLPHDSLKRNFKQNNINPLAKKIKVLAPINADCDVCINELKKWMSFMKSFNKNEVGFIFLINSIDNLNNFTIMDSLEIHFDYPYFQDDNKKLFNLNAFPEEKLHQTVLLDKKNKVILIGNPILSEKIKNLYVREIKKRIY